MSGEWLIWIGVLVVVLYLIICMDGYVRHENNPEIQKARKELGESEE